MNLILVNIINNLIFKVNIIKIINFKKFVIRIHRIMYKVECLDYCVCYVDVDVDLPELINS